MVQRLLFLGLALFLAACTNSVGQALNPQPSQLLCSGFSSRPLPDAEARLTAALTDRGFAPASGSASELGEICNGRFGTMGYRYGATATVRSLTDEALLGDDLAALLDILLGSATGANTELVVIATAGGASQTFRCTASFARGQRSAGATGAALVAAMRAAPRP